MLDGRVVGRLPAMALGGVLLVTASAPAQRAAPADLPPQPAQRDVIGGYTSQYILVKVRPGVEPAQLEDGSLTFRRAASAQNHTPAADAAVLEAQSQALADAIRTRNASNIRTALMAAPANKILAAKYGLDRWFAIEVPAGTDTLALADDVKAFDALVELATVDVIGGIATVPNDEIFGAQWGMNNSGQNGGTIDADIDAPECWDLHQGVAPTVIAVLDTGVQHFDPAVVGSIDHPDLIGRVITGYDFWDGNADTSDYHGHGTHCAGTIAALTNNVVGIAGMNWNATILAVKVVSDAGGGNAATCADGIIFATDNGADIISMSLQYYNLIPGHVLESAVAYAYDSGVLPIAAAGNFQGATIAYPAKYPKCMAVGATTNADLKWSGSNTGPELDVTAPGHSIFSLWKNSGYNTISGTSMAAPFVSGLASLLLTYNPNLTLPEIESHIRDTAEDKGAPGFDTSFGYGRINAAAALNAAAPAACPGNTNSDQTVDVNDLIAVISSWGPCVISGGCPADIAPPGPPLGDGVINVDDLLAVIAGWGECP